MAAFRGGAVRLLEAFDVVRSADRQGFASADESVGRVLVHLGRVTTQAGFRMTREACDHAEALAVFYLLRLGYVVVAPNENGGVRCAG